MNNEYGALISYFDKLVEQEWIEKLPQEFLEMPVCQLGQFNNSLNLTLSFQPLDDSLFNDLSNIKELIYGHSEPKSVQTSPTQIKEMEESILVEKQQI